MVAFAIQKDGPDIVCALTGLSADEKIRVRAEYLRLFGEMRFIGSTTDSFMGPVINADEARLFLGTLEDAGMAFEYPTQTRLQIAQIPLMLCALHSAVRY